MSLSILAKLGMDSSEFKKGLNDAGNESRSFGQKLSSAITSATKIAGLALAGFAVKGTKDMIDFQKGISEVFTLMPGISKENMGKMSDDVRELARMMGIDLQDAVTSLYSAISAGVNPDNAVEFLRTSAKASIGGVATLKDATSALTTVINGYGMSAKDATKVSDVLFSVIKNGETTMTELGQNIGKVTPIASALGVSIQEVGAMFAVLTKQMGSGKTAEAGTAIRSMLAELAKEGMKANENFKALGHGGFKDFIKNGGQVKDALLMMKEEAEKSNLSLMDMFRGVEAGNGALMLVTKSGKEFSDQLKNITGDAGATEEAFQTMEQTVSRQIDKLMSNFKEMGLQIGEAFLPVINDLVPKLSEAFVRMTPTLQSVAQTIGDLLLFVAKYSSEIATAVKVMAVFTVTAKAMLIVVKIVASLRALALALKAGTMAMWSLNASMYANPIGAVIALVAGLVAGLYLLAKATGDCTKAEEARLEANKKFHEEYRRAQEERIKLAKSEYEELVKAIDALRDQAEESENMPKRDRKDELDGTRNLIEMQKDVIKNAETELRLASRSFARKGAEHELFMENLKAGKSMVDMSTDMHLTEERILAMRNRMLKAQEFLLASRKKLKDLQEDEARLSKVALKHHEDIAKVMDVTRKNFALTRNEAGKVVILAGQIRDLELAKKKIIDDATRLRGLETNKAVDLRNVEADILAKRLQLEDLIKNKLKVARQDELNAVKDIITELRTALQLEKDRANDAKANAEAKEAEVKALRDNLVEAQKELDKFKGFFNKDIRGKLKINVGELRKEFKKLKEEGKLPDNVNTLKDFEMMVRHQASSAKIRRDQIIEDGRQAKADAEELRDIEADALEEQRIIQEEIAIAKEDALKLEQDIAGEQKKTFEEIQKERKELERVLLDMQKVNVLPMFDATIVEAIESQAENLKRLDHNVADLVGKDGSISVDVDLDESDINKETTQVAIHETLQGFFVNQ